MSKIPADTLQEAVSEILRLSKEKKRNFLETIELQIALKNYDPQKDKRFSGTIRLPIAPRKSYKVCVLGDAKDIELAEKAGLNAMSVDEMKKLKKDKKKVKKLAQSYDAFLASSSLIKKIPRLLGPGLNRAGKFPSVLGNDDVQEKYDAEAASVKFQLKSKKTLCMGVPIANVGMTEAEIKANIILAMNFLVSLLKKHWQMIKRVYIKSTMGPSFRVYGF